MRRSLIVVALCAFLTLAGTALAVRSVRVTTTAELSATGDEISKVSGQIASRLGTCRKAQPVTVTVRGEPGGDALRADTVSASPDGRWRVRYSAPRPSAGAVYSVKVGSTREDSNAGSVRCRSFVTSAAP